MNCLQFLNKKHKLLNNNPDDIKLLEETIIYKNNKIIELESKLKSCYYNINCTHLNCSNTSLLILNNTLHQNIYTLTNDNQQLIALNNFYLNENTHLKNIITNSNKLYTITE